MLPSGTSQHLIRFSAPFALAAGLLSLSAAAAFGAEETGATCDAASCAAAEDAGPPASPVPTQAPDAGTPGPSSGPQAGRGERLVVPLGEGSAELRPSRVRPGDLFEIRILGPFEAAGASVRFRGEPFSVFPAEPGALRGFGAVPADAPEGPAPVEVTVASAGDAKAITATPELFILHRPTEATELKVDPKFTRPSQADRARIAADGKAITAAYRVEYGPLLFAANFSDPRDGAERNSLFGERRIFNGALKSRHLGLDIDGKTGDLVRAANDGVVRLARDCFYSGNTVLVSHGAGFFTGYFHLSKMLVKNGQQVKKGQVVGLLGMTGRVTGPHLHFHAKLLGTSVDPEALLGFDFLPARQ
jgi:murein DD-endopeptidase MepM/ murein hydrolase activator NlpD